MIEISLILAPTIFVAAELLNWRDRWRFLTA